MLKMAICLQHIYLFICSISQLMYSTHTSPMAYESLRQQALNFEDKFLLGGMVKLSAKEQSVEDLFMEAKLNELSVGFSDPTKNAAAMHFFKAKDLIERSKIFQILQRMPKGALLHSHLTAAVSSKWVLQNITYMDGLMRCTRSDNVSILSFRRNYKKHKCTSKYVYVSDERASVKDVEKYDMAMERLFNLYTPLPEIFYPNINIVWKKFQSMFSVLGDALLYLPAYRAFVRQLLQELYDDNIMYIEVRASLSQLYLSETIEYPVETTFRELFNIAQEFQRENTDFYGVKVIINTQRGSDNLVVQSKINDYLRLRNLYPNAMVGFDLVGQEDKGKPLYQFADLLTNTNDKVDLVLHAGETNWYGSSTDINLLDAILLNTTRLGHAYALLKHPVLLQAVKRRNIGIELSPISNQVLNLVWDMRNHPGSFYISQGLPVVICNDDPGLWNAKGLSYDFYYAIMALAPNNAGLKTLKKLVWNSIEQSILTKKERKQAYEMLSRSWDKFLDDILRGGFD